MTRNIILKESPRRADLEGTHHPSDTGTDLSERDESARPTSKCGKAHSAAAKVGEDDVEPADVAEKSRGSPGGPSGWLAGWLDVMLEKMAKLWRGLLTRRLPMKIE